MLFQFAIVANKIIKNNKHLVYTNRQYQAVPNCTLLQSTFLLPTNLVQQYYRADDPKLLMFFWGSIEATHDNHN